MEPSSFTKTSFCNIEIDNITKNESKQYILNQMSLLCSGIKYNSRYAKVFNEQFSKNLNNPHVFFLKSSGTPYLLFMSQINGINYCFFIDKKIKEGYDYPKIFILPYQFSPELYKGSLFECELIRKKNKKWCLAINDIYYHEGKSLKKTIIIDRINTIHTILTNQFTENDFHSTCPLFIKKYFDYKDEAVKRNDTDTPFYTYRIVNLNKKILTTTRYERSVNTNKYHEVIGFWRNYKSGKRVWINSQWRGDISRGIIEKDYVT